MMYREKYATTQYGETGLRHWNDSGLHDSSAKKIISAKKAFEKGMVFLMQGDLLHARQKFMLCLKNDSSHPQAQGHLEVADFYEKSQKAAEAALKYLFESGKAHKFDPSGVWKMEFTVEDAKETLEAVQRAGFDVKSAAVALGMGRAYLSLAASFGREEWKALASGEFDRALSILGNDKESQYMKAAVHRFCAQLELKDEDKKAHLASMHRLDAHIPDDW